MSVTETAAREHDSTPDVPAAPPDPSDDGLKEAARRLAPWAIFVGVLAVMVETVAVPLDNTDTYFHLRFGHEFLHSWSLRHPGSVSTFATAHWLPTQWLSEIWMAKFEDWFGLAGVAWLSGLWQVALIAALYLLARRRSTPLISVLVLMPTIAAVSLGLSARPQVLSYVMVAVTVAAWLGTQEDGRPRWWLIPVTWLWAMLHGMWSLGIGIGVVVVIGLALDRRLDRRGLVKAAAVPVASAVAAALTPVGPGLYHAVLGVGDRSQFFSEWKSPDYTSVPACMILAACLALTIVLFVRGPRRSWTDVLLLLTALGFALWCYRTIPVAAVVLMPLLAGSANDVLHRPRTPTTRLEVGGILGACAASLVVLALVVPHTSAEPLAQPAWLGPAADALPAGTPVVSDWDFGGYLLWAYPRLDPVMHGYGDTYTVSELHRNTDIIEASTGWQAELAATGAHVAFLKPDTALTYGLVHDAGWTVVHRSPTLEMLTAPSH